MLQLPTVADRAPADDRLVVPVHAGLGPAVVDLVPAAAVVAGVGDEQPDLHRRRRAREPAQRELHDRAVLGARRVVQLQHRRGRVVLRRARRVEVRVGVERDGGGRRRCVGDGDRLRRRRAPLRVRRGQLSQCRCRWPCRCATGSGSSTSHCHRRSHAQLVGTPVLVSVKLHGERCGPARGARGERRRRRRQVSVHRDRRRRRRAPTARSIAVSCHHDTCRRGERVRRVLARRRATVAEGPRPARGRARARVGELHGRAARCRSWDSR